MNRVARGAYLGQQVGLTVAAAFERVKTAGSTEVVRGTSPDPPLANPGVPG